MGAPVDLLPPNATPFERAISLAADPYERIDEGVTASRGIKLVDVPSTILPYLVHEFGLGAITPYLPDYASVVERGIRWQRLLGTPAAITEAFSWLEYAYQLEEMPTRRTRWHLFQAKLDRFPGDEDDLDPLETLAHLSEPARSEFWRGFHNYDVRELEWAYSTWAGGMWSDCSGIRLHEGGAKWSFGRTFEPSAGVHEMTEGELTDIGIWLEGGDAPQGWGAFPWTTEGVGWLPIGAGARATIIVTGLLARTCWIGLYDAEDAPIGFRKARAWHAVEPNVAGEYQVGTSRYKVGAYSAGRVYVEALTGFGEGYGETVARWSVTIDGALPVGAPAGTGWLGGDTLDGGVEVGSFAISPAERLEQMARDTFRAILRVV